MRQASIALRAIFLFPLAVPAQVVDSEHARKTLEIYERNVELETLEDLDNVPEVAGYITDKLVAGSIPRDNIEIVPIGETTAPIA